MSTADRATTSRTISRIVPHILQGVHMDFLASQNITHTQCLILIAIGSYRRVSMKRLASNLHVSTPTATGLVDRLVRGGYLLRTKCAEDRRVVYIELSNRGRRFVEDFQTMVADRWARVLGHLSGPELKQFSILTAKLERKLAEESAQS